jgi:hypothetical protein
MADGGLGVEAQAEKPRWLERLAHGYARVQRLVPLISLAIGVASALLMDRRPESAWLVVAGSTAGWVLLLGFALFVRGEAGGRWQRTAQALLPRLTQSALQHAILFTLPLYVQAATSSLRHGAFLLLLAVAGSITLWDPACRAVLARPRAAAALLAVSTFAGANAVLPVLGLGNRESLVASAALTTVGLPLLAWLNSAGRERRWRLVGRSLLIGALAPGFLLLGGAALVPPAPLRFVGGGVGTQLDHRELLDAAAHIPGAPEQLVCLTAVAAPRGLRDRLLHVWSKNGRRVDAIEVTIAGGRDSGYRTWSTKRNLGAQSAGRWTCAVETASGQLVGRVKVRVGG